jgi:hypothetical protein
MPSAPIICSGEAPQYHVYPKVTASEGELKLSYVIWLESTEYFKIELSCSIRGATGHNPCVKLLVSA